MADAAPPPPPPAPPAAPVAPAAAEVQGDRGGNRAGRGKDFNASEALITQAKAVRPSMPEVMFPGLMRVEDIHETRWSQVNMVSSFAPMRVRDNVQFGVGGQQSWKHSYITVSASLVVLATRATGYAGNRECDFLEFATYALSHLGHISQQAACDGRRFTADIMAMIRDIEGRTGQEVINTMAPFMPRRVQGTAGCDFFPSTYPGCVVVGMPHVISDDFSRSLAAFGARIDNNQDDDVPSNDAFNILFDAMGTNSLYVKGLCAWLTSNG